VNPFPPNATLTFLKKMKEDNYDDEIVQDEKEENDDLYSFSRKDAQRMTRYVYS
jgi:hypothetical protein